MGRFKPEFEYGRKGNITAMKCQECGQRLKPITKKHDLNDCEWYKDYTQLNKIENRYI